MTARSMAEQLSRSSEAAEGEARTLRGQYDKARKQYEVVAAERVGLQKVGELSSSREELTVVPHPLPMRRIIAGRPHAGCSLAPFSCLYCLHMCTACTATGAGRPEAPGD
jgi:hypothetical protein